MLSEKDLEKINNKLRVPPKVKLNYNEEILSYFTEEGLSEYKDLITVLEYRLASNKNKLGCYLVKNEINYSNIKKKQIIYEDKHQVIIRMAIRENK